MPRSEGAISATGLLEGLSDLGTHSAGAAALNPLAPDSTPRRRVARARRSKSSPRLSAGEGLHGRFTAAARKGGDLWYRCREHNFPVLDANPGTPHRKLFAPTLAHQLGSACACIVLNLCYIHG